MNILHVSGSGLYDYEREVLKKHTKLLGKAVSIKTDDLAKVRLDHADLIIYWDESRAFFYDDISINTVMINHAAAMETKGVKVLLVTRSGVTPVYWVWWVSSMSVTQRGKVESVWYAFHTKETGPARVSNNGFNTINWSEFEKRFVLEEKKHG